jgi:hypothetical protein
MIAENVWLRTRSLSFTIINCNLYTIKMHDIVIKVSVAMQIR